MRCPSYACSEGGPIHEVRNPPDYEIPQAILDRHKDRGMEIWHCTYCKFLWFFKRELGDPLPSVLQIGFFDGAAQPGSFQSTPNHRLRDDLGIVQRRRRK